tara:strand:- start:371 stop:814 length:444 start_codon:yes stop_codon:yes gene_type:complete
MHTYKFGYSSPEDSDYIELKHKKKFSDEEFEDLVVEATVEVLINRRPFHACGPEEGVYTEEFLQRHRQFWNNREIGGELKSDEEIKQIHRRNVYFHFTDIIIEVRDCLIDIYNFEEVEYDAFFKIFGWQGLVDEEDDWEEKIPYLLK